MEKCTLYFADASYSSIKQAAIELQQCMFSKSKPMAIYLMNREIIIILNNVFQVATTSSINEIWKYNNFYSNIIKQNT